VGAIVATGRLLSGRYQIDEPLGRGGMATVWRGRDLRLDRPVAIKALTGPWLADATAMARFDREARTAARLAHPNIVSVHDVGSHDGSRFLVMELIEGATLAEMLLNGPLPIADAIAIAAQTCDGLAAAHQAGVIHRDIKPANLIVTPTGVVKICDFGIARAPFDPADLTGPTSAVGSLKFMAPEQLDGLADARTDLYGLGCTMYAMLAGRAPFIGDAAELQRLHRHQPPAPVRDYRADVDVRLEALVAQMLVKSPAARPASAAEVKARLEELQRAPATTANGRRAYATAPSTFPVPYSGRPALSVRTAVRPGAKRPNTYRRRRWRPAVAGILVVFAATAVSLVTTSWLAPSTGAQPLAQWIPAVAPTVTVPHTPDPRPPDQALPIEPSPPAPTNPAAEETSLPPADPIATMRVSIQRQVNGGNLNPDKASDLYKKVDEIARAINDDNIEDANHRIKDLRGRLASLLAEGQLTAGGYDEMIQALDSIADMVL
jgi:serine/threonine-protein kinase